MKKRTSQTLSETLKKFTRPVSNQAGFTLTEMLIVIALIALVGTFAVGKIIGQYNQSKIKATKIQMNNLATLLDQFRLDCGFYPSGDQGLDALVSKPSGGRECRNYNPEGYVRRVPRDGFDNEFLYESDGNRYVITSLGSDNRPGGEDEIDKDIKSNEIE